MNSNTQIAGGKKIRTGKHTQFLTTFYMPLVVNVSFHVEWMFTVQFMPSSGIAFC